MKLVSLVSDMALPSAVARCLEVRRQARRACSAEAGKLQHVLIEDVCLRLRVQNLQGIQSVR